MATQTRNQLSNSICLSYSSMVPINCSSIQPFIHVIYIVFHTYCIDGQPYTKNMAELTYWDRWSCKGKSLNKGKQTCNFNTQQDPARGWRTRVKPRRRVCWEQGTSLGLKGKKKEHSNMKSQCGEEATVKSQIILRSVKCGMMNTGLAYIWRGSRCLQGLRTNSWQKTSV